MFDKDELDYRSSDSSGIPDVGPVAQDVADKGVIQAWQALHAEQIALYDSVDKLNVRDTKFTVEQQIAMNQEMKARLVLFKSLLDDVLESMRG